MIKLKEIWKYVPEQYKLAYWVCLIASIGLLIAGFVCPPLGEIDPSVLTSVGELFAFASLGVGIKALDKGLKTVIEHNDTKVTINKEKDDSDGENL